MVNLTCHKTYIQFRCVIIHIIKVIIYHFNEFLYKLFAIGKVHKRNFNYTIFYVFLKSGICRF